MCQAPRDSELEQEAGKGLSSNPSTVMVVVVFFFMEAEGSYVVCGVFSHWSLILILLVVITRLVFLEARIQTQREGGTCSGLHSQLLTLNLVF